MKIFRLLLLVACVAIPLSGFARKNIKVRGMRDKKEKSITLTDPVEAWLEDNGKDLSLQFYRNLGSVKVTVTNLSGKTVYEATVDAAAMSSWHIVLGNISKGEYMLSITNDDGVLGGEFFIN